MGFYQPGIFKNKLLNITVEEKPEEKVEQVIEVKKDEKIEDIQIKREEKYLVKPVEISENAVWKRIKTQDVIKNRLDEVKPIKYDKMDKYLRRKEYNLFLENEWEKLWDMYDSVLNYSTIFLDKARDSEDNKAFYDFTKVVFNNLKIYE